MQFWGKAFINLVGAKEAAVTAAAAAEKYGGEETRRGRK